MIFFLAGHRIVTQHIAAPRPAIHQIATATASVANTFARVYLAMITRQIQGDQGQRFREFQ
jgi:hypothetical protein